MEILTEELLILTIKYSMIQLLIITSKSFNISMIDIYINIIS